MNMEKERWIEMIKKAFIMFGFTYFSVAITTQSWTTVTPSLLAAGLYFFTEMGRFYKINRDNKTLKASKKKTKQFNFLI